VPVQLDDGTRVRRNRQPRVGREQRLSGSISRTLYKELRALFLPMLQETKALLPWLKSSPAASQVASALLQMKYTWARVLGPSIRGIASKWKASVDSSEREKLERSLSTVLGVKNVRIQDVVGDSEPVQLMLEQAVGLIQTVPEEYFNEIQQAVTRHYLQQEQPEGRTLTQQIEFLSGHTYKRAKLIAVDQTQKMHSIVQQQRQTELGIEEYVWRTAKDIRVVGTPGGVNPVGSKAHGNHYAREGKRFRWDSPPADGHPGWPVRCRCHAEPVIDYNKLNILGEDTIKTTAANTKQMQPKKASQTVAASPAAERPKMPFPGGDNYKLGDIVTLRDGKKSAY